MGQNVQQSNEESLSPSRRARKVLGARRLAEICGLTTDAVRKWDQRGGLVPAEYLERILRAAEAERLPLAARDLIAEAQP